MKPLHFFAGPPRLESPPTWGRGLKQQRRHSVRGFERVAPHVGAWIETPTLEDEVGAAVRRPPRGGVD